VRIAGESRGPGQHSRPAERSLSKTYGICSTRTSGSDGKRKALAFLRQPQGTEKSLANAHAPARVAPLVPYTKLRAEMPEATGSGPWKSLRPSLRTDGSSWLSSGRFDQLRSAETSSVGSKIATRFASALTTGPLVKPDGVQATLTY
jgi:hypothetical protein